MADSGYTKYWHWLESDLMKSDLNGREFRMIIAIIRKTIGYGKNSDTIAYTQLSEMTNISRNHCVEVLKSLELKKWVKVKRTKKGINKITLLKGVPENGNRGVPQIGTERIPNSGTTKHKAKATIMDLPLDEAIPNGKENSYWLEEDFDD